MTADRIPLFGPGLQRLTHLGLDVAQVLGRAGLSPALRHQTKVSLTTSQYFALWAAIEALSGDALIGLRIGGEARPDQFDPASFAALHSSTFAEALDRLARYKRLTCPEAIRVESNDHLARISFHWLCAKDAAPGALTDAAFANIHLLLRLGTGKNIAPLRVEWAAQRGEPERYAAYFGCEVRPGAAHDALVYPRATLKQCFSTSNPDLINVLLPGLEMRLDATPLSSFDLQVKAVLSQMMSGERPSMEAVARRLCLSPRTLQRRLSEVHTSYQQILDAVRLDTACKLLGHTQMEPGEIAFCLGFEEANSFQRAFHKWQGMTPTQWRSREGEVPFLRSGQQA